MSRKVIRYPNEQILKEEIIQGYEEVDAAKLNWTIEFLQSINATEIRINTSGMNTKIFFFTEDLGDLKLIAGIGSTSPAIPIQDTVQLNKGRDGLVKDSWPWDDPEMFISRAYKYFKADIYITDTIQTDDGEKYVIESPYDSKEDFLDMDYDKSYKSYDDERTSWLIGTNCDKEYVQKHLSDGGWDVKLSQTPPNQNQ